MNDFKIKAQKWAIWIAFVGVLWLLLDLFPVIFLTFILSYIGNTVVKLLTARFPYRRFNLTLAYFVFIALLLLVGSIVVPRMFHEARDLARHYVEPDVAATDTPVVGIIVVTDTRTVFARETSRYIDQLIVSTFGDDVYKSFKKSGGYDRMILQVEESTQGLIPRVVVAVRDFANNFFKLVFHFILAMIFSFLILWDLPRLGKSIAGFASGRTADVYEEIAPGMRAFGVMLGKAFEAQTGIALTNAVLTAIGFAILSVPSIALLSTIVFFCSYIPVLGVILSTLPAALLAAKVGGLSLILKLVVMVLIVHAIEAYILNPMIYGHHLRMHPVGVLVILLVGEHLFGVWGMILGVPVSAFIMRYVIEGKDVV